MFLVPHDINREILYNLSPEDILNRCIINKYTDDLCHNDNFWQSYVKNRYNPNYYVKYVNLSLHDMNVWNYLMGLAHHQSIFSDKNHTWKNLALWLENSKPIRYQCTDKSISISSSITPISKYDKITSCVYRYVGAHQVLTGYMYGNCLMIKLENHIPKMTALNCQLGNKIFPQINDNNILIKDINIQGINLLDYIDTVVCDRI